MAASIDFEFTPRSTGEDFLHRVVAWMEEHPHQLPPSYQEAVELQQIFQLPDSVFDAEGEEPK